MSGAIHGQTSSASNLQSTYFDTSEFPLWAKDLRRAEIVAIGSFPFTFFFATFAMDSYRYASHGRDVRYAPWPFKSSGAVDMTQDELILTMSIAAVGSVVVSLTDYFIVKYRRNKQNRELEKIAGSTPIIIRTPHGGKDSGAEEAPAGEEPPVPAEPAESGGSSTPETVPEMP